MMYPLFIGQDLDSGKSIELNASGLSRHIQIAGATGAGKTVALHAMLRPLMKEPRHKAAMFIIDPLGGLSRDLLMWIASPRCPNHVRRRLLYIDAANDSGVCLPFNPIQQARGDSTYYHVARAVDLILRAWSSQDLSQMARLMQWSYSAVTVLAELGLPLSLSQYLLHPGSDEHKALLRMMPERLRYRWMEILTARGSEATRILESTRNRFDPIHEAPQTKRMFGVAGGRFDTEQLIRDRRIVIINVAKKGKLTPLLGSTIGSLMLNEILETAFRMASTEGRAAVDPTMIVLDEFQRFVGPDIEDAIPTVRQAGLQLVLAHQSFSQLQQGDLDLRTMIWQCQNRLMFANNAEDADIIANELAVHRFDPAAVKLAIHQRKQLIAGHRIEWLESEGVSDTAADSVVKQNSMGYSNNRGLLHVVGEQGFTENDGRGLSHGETSGRTTANSQSKSRSRSQSLVPIYDEFRELSSIQYSSFDEQRLEWMKTVRRLKTGHCFGKFVDDDSLYRILVDYDPVRETPSALRRLEELLQANFEQDCFMSIAEADRQYELARLSLLRSEKIILPAKRQLLLPESDARVSAVLEPNAESSIDPFRTSSEMD